LAGGDGDGGGLPPAADGDAATAGLLVAAVALLFAWDGDAATAGLLVAAGAALPLAAELPVASDGCAGFRVGTMPNDGAPAGLLVTAVGGGAAAAGSGLAGVSDGFLGGEMPNDGAVAGLSAAIAGGGGGAGLLAAVAGGVAAAGLFAAVAGGVAEGFFAGAGG
jgi:hypothetical protein